MRHMYLTNRLHERLEETGGRVNFLPLLVVIFREAPSGDISAVAVLDSLFATEAKESQVALELEDRLLEHVAFLLR